VRANDAPAAEIEAVKGPVEHSVRVPVAWVRRWM